MEPLELLLQDTVVSDSPADAWLVVMNGPEDGRRFDLRGEAATIGRADGVDVGLTLDVSVSRRHALIRRDRNQYSIEDAGSSFGTRVDGVAISGRVTLADGVTIHCGATELKFNVAQRS